MTDETTWRRSSRCSAGNCVEVEITLDRVRLRNSTSPEQMVDLTPDEWAAFVAGVRAGEFGPEEDA